MLHNRLAIILIVVAIVLCNIAIIVTLRTLSEAKDVNGSPLIKNRSKRDFLMGFLGVFVMTFCFCCWCCFCCGGRLCGIKDSHELLKIKNWRRSKTDNVGIMAEAEKNARWYSPRTSLTLDGGPRSHGCYSIMDYETKASPTVPPDVVEELAKLHKKIVVPGV